MKNLPENYSLVDYQVSRTKGFFYIGKSNKINTDCYKIGITKNLKSRLSNYRNKIPDFEYLKTWEVKAYRHLEKTIIGNHYKSGFESYGSEWFVGSKEQYNDLIKEVEFLISSTFYKKNNRYYKLHGHNK